MGQGKILVVDDDPHVCRVTSYALQKAGYRVSAAYSAAQARAALASEAPDLVLLDLVLPDADGSAMCLELKASASPPRVLVVTGQSSPKELERAAAAGADEVMTKPFSPSALVLAVARLLSSLARQGTEQPL